MVETVQIIRALMLHRARFLFEHRFVSVGFPEINGFELRIEPPWRDFEESEIVRLRITSAGVLPIVQEPFGVLLVSVRDDHVSPRWEIPSGSVDPADEDIHHTVRREMYEETGLAIPRNSAVPLTYNRQDDERAGVQLMIPIELPPTEMIVGDQGRFYLSPFPGAWLHEVSGLVIEPMDVFMSPGQSLLRYSKHPWAYRGIGEALRYKLELLAAVSPIF